MPGRAGDEVLAFYRQIRMRYDPKLRIYLVADNLSTHKTPATGAGHLLMI